MSSSTAIATAQAVNGRTGYKVFPANPATKGPVIQDPFGRAAGSTDTIETLFAPFPNSVPAIPCGPTNGITVIDLDRKNGVDGLKSLRGLGIAIPETVVISTPTQGFHLYFDTSTDRLPNSVSKLGPGIDVRGEGGYVIAPGSQTPSGTYIWRQDLYGPEWAPAKMPDALRHLILKPAITQRSNAGRGPVSLVRSRLNLPIEEGTRNAEFAARIGYLLRYMPADEAWRLTRHLNDTVTHPPLPERELHSIFVSISKREARK
jgi:hypothetical protein